MPAYMGMAGIKSIEMHGMKSRLIHCKPQLWRHEDGVIHGE